MVTLTLTDRQHAILLTLAMEGLMIVFPHAPPAAARKVLHSVDHLVKEKLEGSFHNVDNITFPVLEAAELFVLLGSAE